MGFQLNHELCSSWKLTHPFIHSLFFIIIIIIIIIIIWEGLSLLVASIDYEGKNKEGRKTEEKMKEPKQFNKQTSNVN
jgi:hypothetical protein